MTRVLAVAGLLVAGMALAAAAAGAPDLLAALNNATARKDCARAFELVRMIEQVGDSGALAVLGGRFEVGRACLGRDPARAAALYRRAAEQGEAVAMARLGRLYVEGRGVPQDIAKARHWFRAGVLALVALEPAQRRPLLRLALDGEVPALLDQQLVWLGLIEWGGPGSEFDLALRMRSGDGVPQNEVAAEHLMVRLAAEGFAPALYEYGRTRLLRAKDARDRRVAFADMRQAADGGYLPAMLNLARRMLEGDDLEQDDYWACIAFWRAWAMGADVDAELAVLEERLGFFRFREARDYAGRSDYFAITPVKSRSTDNRADSAPPPGRPSSD